MIIGLETHSKRIMGITSLRSGMTTAISRQDLREWLLISINPFRGPVRSPHLVRLLKNPELQAILTPPVYTAQRNH